MLGERSDDARAFDGDYFTAQLWCFPVSRLWMLAEATSFNQNAAAQNQVKLENAWRI
eukprot:CAMPEP_0194044772 /NCGR_PEP_ID=MMETSP0009_2-20130614/16184_1 /TAXON_ID=210454 /ORGANISM="Grammatophora oceanica, Strain CCMP 410" /LENGTH=56 /DNA_ID=CAMNT_0038689385 /DNA_START=119 /DNA_END=286 /DNA_ORIENTATION=+